jgi:hypothetical protein
MRFGGNFNPEWGYLAPAPSFMRTARIVVVATAIGATAGAAVVLSLAERPMPGALADAGKSLVVVHSLVQPAEAATPVAAALAPAATPASPVITAKPAMVPPVVRPQIQANAQPVVQPPVQALPTALPQPSALPQPTALPQPSALPQPTALPQPSVLPQPIAQPSVQASVAPERVTPPSPAAAPAPAASDSASTSTPAAPASVAALAESPSANENAPALASDDVNATPDQTAVQKNAKKHRANDHGAPLAPQANATGPNKKPVSPEHGIGPLLRHLFSARAGNSYFPN